MKLSTALLTFEVNGQGSEAAFILNEKPEKAARSSDFWRLILDDGERTEIPVCSRRQSGTVEEIEDGLRIRYDHLISEYGDRYEIGYTAEVRIEDGLLRFSSRVENRAEGVRVNECFCPMADFTELFGKKEDDRLYVPHGLGTCVRDPWKMLRNRTPEYYIHDTTELFFHWPYPSCDASMAWLGIESGNRFVYFARCDDQVRQCLLSIRHRIHSDPSNMTVTVDHFPAARTGETVEIPPAVIGVLEGDWRAGAERYRAWADRAFFRVREKAEWVKNLTGFQCVIMRSQYGEDYYRAEDLPRLYEAGAAHGIHTLMLFGWWKEGMDRGYPAYTEPYPGAFEKLRDAIRKVRAMGGRVILECTSMFIDPCSDFYKEHGAYIAMRDINGNELRPAFGFCGLGQMRIMHGHRQFVMICSGTKVWRDQLEKQMHQLGDTFDADCVFLDCYGGSPFQPCFNDRHEHGNRVDEEWRYHRAVFQTGVDYCAETGRVLGSEVVTDIAASYTQFLHGLVNADFRINSDSFPQMFRYTFPEVITTNRGLISPEGDFARQIRYSLTTGVRMDAGMYVARGNLSQDEAYAREVGFYAGKLKEYSDFYFDGRFTVIDVSELPGTVKRGEFYSADRSRVLRVLYNASGDTVRVSGTELKAGELRYDVFDADGYPPANRLSAAQGGVT